MAISMMHGLIVLAIVLSPTKAKSFYDEADHGIFPNQLITDDIASVMMIDDTPIKTGQISEKGKTLQIKI